MNYESGIMNKSRKTVDRRRHNSLFIIHNSRKSEGFTLFEMIVSLGVFSVAMTVMMGALLSITSAQKKAVAIQTAEDNLRFAIDAISKEVRTGYDYDCGGDGAPYNCAASPSDALAFTRADGTSVAYKLEGGSIKKSTDGGLNFFAITGTDVTVSMLKFYVVGVGSGDGIQPRATIIIKAEAGTKERIRSPFNVQTTVAQREMDS